MSRRVLIAGAFALTFIVFMSASAFAQSVPYLFTRIADTVQNPDAHLGGVRCVGMNDQGVVIVQNSQNALWRGDGQTFALAVSPSHSTCPSINDLGEIAYVFVDGPTSIRYLYKNSGGVVTTLARSDVSPFFHSPSTYLPSLNILGNAMFSGGAAPFSGEGIYIGPGGAAIYDPTPASHPLSSVTIGTMNDSNTATFRATQGGTIGIYRGSTIPLIEAGDAVSGGVIRIHGFTRPVINNNGRVAFGGSLEPGGVPGSGTDGVYTTDDGGSVKLVATSPVDRFSLNDAGAVALRRTTSGGAGSGLFLGRPGAIDQKVINQGEPLDGSTLTEAFVWEESLNSSGQIAFWAHLAAGRQGIYRADPQWLKALAFTQKIPGCGPITGKLKLTAPAPEGGLTVTLANTNPAASIPLTVFVPKGKTSVAFQITPTAVTSSTTGAITASFAAQSINRNLTVRPIGVSAVALAPNPVIGGTPVTGTVALECAAAPGDITVSLSSSKPSVAHPDIPLLQFAAGVQMLTFPVSTNPVAAPSTATIKASANGTSKGKKLTVNP